MEKKEKLEIQISRLKKIREDLGMNRTEFSNYIGIPLRTIEEWEAGRRQMQILCTADNIARIEEKNNI